MKQNTRPLFVPLDFLDSDCDRVGSDRFSDGGYVDRTLVKKHPQGRLHHSSSWDSWT